MSWAGRFWRRFDDLSPLLPVGLWAYSLAVASFIVYREYNEIPFLASVTFRANDGWCEIPGGGIGVHCFGDFQDVYSKDELSPWTWVAPFSHPPLSHSIQWMFGQLTTLTGSSLVALGAWLLVGVLALTLPAFWAMRGNDALTRASIFLLLGLGSLPVLVTLDRGNSVFLVSVAFFGMAWAAWQQRWSLAITFSVLAVLLRPQAILLCLVFLGLGKLRPFLIASVSGLVGLVVSFWIYPGDHLGNLKQWLLNIAAYQDYNSAYSHDVVNLSLFRSVILGLETLGVDSGYLAVSGSSSDGALFQVPILGSWLQSGSANTIYTIACILLLGMAGVLMYVRRARMSFPMVLLIPAILVMVIPQTSFLYYSTLLLTPFAFIVRLGKQPKAPMSLLVGSRATLRRAMNGSAIALAVVALVPVALPLALLVWDEAYVGSNLSAHLLGPLAGLVLLVALVSLLVPQRSFSFVVEGE